MKKSDFIKKIMDGRIVYFLFSLIAATVIWIFITGTDTEEMKQTFPGVQVELLNEDVLRNSKNMVITDLNVGTVTLELSGPRRIIAALSSADLKAQVDVSKLSQAAYTSQGYTVKFPDGIDISGITVNRKTPDVVSFMVSAQTKIQVQVRGSFEGDIAPGFTADAPVFEPSTITVYGPEAYLKNIAYAWVSFGENVSADKSYEVETSFMLMDTNGNEYISTGITTSEDTVKAVLPIMQIKDVPLTVDLIEGAGATSANTSVDIDPPFVRLSGDSAILSGLNKIVLKTVNLKDFNDTYTDTFPITIDNGLRNISGATEARVTVEIVGLVTKNYTVTNLSCINSTEGIIPSIQTESLNVTLRGPEDAIEKIQNENIRAVADLTDYNESTGTYFVTVKIYIDGYPNVGAIGEYSIAVDLNEAK